MEKPISLERLFKEKIFRIPDYQRGYAWQREQLKAFWEDLVNLKEDRSHYTGVLTLTEVSNAAVQEDSKEFWLVDDHSYRLYHVVDGQQRLTTFVIFIQAFAEFFRVLPEHQGKPSAEIYVTDRLAHTTETPTDSITGWAAPLIRNAARIPAKKDQRERCRKWDPCLCGD
ncbi:hypothetical protein CF70_013800 [Cupriavidus sp. SK-3]|uniref:DUF262 domain-containing protein n=1 Tax=Cupriavidus sp. SK-3 TaxID=1470558 RepID=UPI0004498CFD|nr:DUF262 domain-containing protein [Cupriavidus sp. SK-3]KDP85458.1 hypothetical protein CF70_013800 [Cupriavidus sp. SK-3]